MVVVMALAIGFAAGLRTFMPLAALRFPKHDWTTVLFALAAIGELIGDKLPSTPARTKWYAFIGRLIVGGYAGGVVASGLSSSFVLGVLLGVSGAVIGTYAGYAWRTIVRERAGAPDIVFALIEDVVSIAIAFSVALRVVA